MRTSTLLIVLALLLFPALAEESRTITITDEDGRNVTVPLDPQSIICLSPGAAEVIYALGESDRIIAVTSDCDMPPALLEKEQIGKSGRDADLERIIELNPDLVIAKTGALFPEEDEQKLVDYGIPVIRYRLLHIDALMPMIQDVGRILGTEEKATEMADQISGYYSAILDRTKDIPDDERPLVYFMSMGHFDWTGNKDSTGHLRIAEAGGRNIASDLQTKVPHVDMEWIIEQNSQVIVYSMSSEQYAEDTPTIEEMAAKRDEIMALPGFDRIDAVKAGRVYVTDITMASGLSELALMLYYAKWFHPDLFEDIDPRAVHEQMLREYFQMDADGIYQVYPDSPVESEAFQESLSTTTDDNGTFIFYGLPVGTYTVTAYKPVMGVYPYLGNATVQLSEDMEEIEIRLKSSDQAELAGFKDASVNLDHGDLRLEGTVYGPNRPGAEPATIPYEDAEVKLTEYSPEI
jgi:iron complex transport system substrate-binding protein